MADRLERRRELTRLRVQRYRASRNAASKSEANVTAGSVTTEAVADGVAGGVTTEAELAEPMAAPHGTEPVSAGFDPMAYLEKAETGWQVTEHGQRVGLPLDWLLWRAGLGPGTAYLPAGAFADINNIRETFVDVDIPATSAALAEALSRITSLEAARCAEG
jgi:hypothetical protein